MAEKQSTIFYHEWLELFEDLSREEIGDITIAILEYEKNGEIPTFSDRTMKAIWKTIRSTLDRNKQKYNEICEKRSAAGKKGGRPRKEEAEEKSKNQKDNFAFSKKAKKADSDSDSERERDSEHDSERERGGGGEKEEPAEPGTTTTTEQIRNNLLQEAIVETWNSHDFVQKIKRVDSPQKRWERTEMAIAVAGGWKKFLHQLQTLDQHAYLKNQPDQGYKVIYDWLTDPEIFQAFLEGRYKDKRGDAKKYEGWEVVEFG